MLNIYVMERGFVMVGEPHPVPDNWMMISLTRCANVRRWGTTAGLGELATKGPIKDKTILDPEPDGTQIAKTAIYRVIPCDEKRWSEWMNS